MPDDKKVCVVDCAEIIISYRAKHKGLTEADMSAVMVAAALAAIEDVHVEPILELGSVLSVSEACKIASAIQGRIKNELHDVVCDFERNAGDHQVVKADSFLEGSLVIVDLSLIDEGD